MRAERFGWLLLAAGMMFGAGAAAEPASIRYQYDVYFDDRPIGSHSFEIDRSGGVKRVRSRAEFQVKIMFVSLYRYEHSADEQWQDGCLSQLASQTDDNGRRFEVRVAEGAAGLQVDRLAPETATESLALDCAGTFAYWDPEQLERNELINSQTGSLTPVTFRFDGSDEVAGEPAHRYRLEPQGMDPILLWYRTSDRRWLQLETGRDKGVLRYRLSSVEPLAETPLDLAAAAR